MTNALPGAVPSPDRVVVLEVVMVPTHTFIYLRVYTLTACPERTPTPAPSPIRGQPVIPLRGAFRPLVCCHATFRG